MATKKKSVGAALEASIPKPEDKYEVESHLRTLADAHEILSDKEKMKKVHKLSGRRHKAVRSLSDLRDRRDDLFNQDDSLD